MRILHITDKMDPQMGGISQGIRTMIAGLTDLGAQNEVVSLDTPGASFLKDELFNIHTPGKGKGPWSYNSNLSTWLCDNLNRFNAVIIHGLWLYHGYATWKASRRYHVDRSSTQPKPKSPKLFVMPHGMLDPYFQLAEGRKLKAIRNRVYWKLIEGKVINGADGLLFTCEKEKQLARKPFRPYLPKNESVVGLGVADPPPFCENMRKEFLSACPGLGDNSYFLFLSRIHEKKGVDLLINAYKQILGKTSPGTLPKLIIAGPGVDTPYGSKILAMTLQYPELKASVFFPGMLKGNAKWGAFYGCDAFILPSHQENFGVAVVEALACGKPALISKQVNICQEIESAHSGIVAEDTLEGTLFLLQTWESLSSEQKRLMGLQARGCFEKNFGVIPASEKVLHALNSLN